MAIFATASIAVSYAWISLSLAPTVEDVSTSVSANGALEMALLTSRTYEDVTLIETSIGASSDVSTPKEANVKWGNIIDLSPSEYGLGYISLKPSRLNLNPSASGEISVGSSILEVPKFGYDGRVQSTDIHSVSGVFENGVFTVNTEDPTHGVRAIGSADTFTLQQKILLSARSAITTSSGAAGQSAIAVLQNNGKMIFDLWNRQEFYGNSRIGTDDLLKLLALANDVGDCLDDIEMSLRNGSIAIIASETDDADLLEQAYEIIIDNGIPLSRALNEIPFSFSGGNAIASWAAEIEQAKAEIKSTAESFERFSKSRCSWSEVEPLLAVFAGKNGVYYNENRFTEAISFDASTRITVMPGSGILSLIADYTGRYEEYVAGWTGENNNSDHLISVRTGADEGRLATLTGIIDNLNAVNATVNTAEINDICGFAVDMAFRVNADNASLLLQTAGKERIYSEYSSWDSGSYIEFSSDNLDESTLLELINGFRVTFIDADGYILGTARPDLEENEKTEDIYRVPLYLYNSLTGADFSGRSNFKEDGAAIVPLQKNLTKIVTAVVWIDGNVIFNPMVSSKDTSVSARINLQFSTDATLVPAQ